MTPMDECSPADDPCRVPPGYSLRPYTSLSICSLLLPSPHCPSLSLSLIPLPREFLKQDQPGHHPSPMATLPGMPFACRSTWKMSTCLFFEIFCAFPLSATLSITVTRTQNSRDTHSLETSRPCTDFECEMAVWLLELWDCDLKQVSSLPLASISLSVYWEQRFKTHRFLKAANLGPSH